MKKILFISTLVFSLILLSCDGSREKETQEQTQQTPEALQEKGSLEMVSKRIYNDDLVEDLYREIVEKTPELKDLETKIDFLHSGKSDSIKVFSNFDRKNQSYYRTADYRIKQIGD